MRLSQFQLQPFYYFNINTKACKLIILSGLLILGLNSCEKEHSPHSTSESNGLLTDLKVNTADTLSTTYVHSFGVDGDTLYTAPSTLLRIIDNKQSKIFVIKYSIDAMYLEFSDAVRERISNNDWPKSVSINVSSQYAYQDMINTLNKGINFLDGNGMFTYKFSSSSAISASELPVKIWIWEIPKEDHPPHDEDIGEWHTNLFDCHSHWGIGTGSCHTKTACPAPATGCYCDVPTKSTTCNGMPICECG